MKHKNLMARLMACVLALVMAVGIGMTPAMAKATLKGDYVTGKDQGYRPADSTPTTPATNTVTVNDAVPGAEYKLYKLLQLEHKEVDGTKEIATYRYSYDATIKKTIKGLVEKEAFAYVAGTPTADNPRLGFGFKVDGDNDLVFITPYTSEADGSVDYDSKENAIVRTMMVEFADELRKSVEATTDAEGNPLGEDALKKLQPSQTKTAPAAADGETTTTVNFTEVPNGYWMITSNAGARSIIFTSPERADISQDVIVNEKNPAPTVDKKVFDYDDAAGTDDPKVAGSWQDANDAQIGDTVEYKITVDLYKGAENIIVYDNMTDGLTFKELKGVKFYPRKSATEYGRDVYKALGGGETTTGPLELTTDVYTLSVNENEHSFTLTFKNAFTNPAANAANRDEKDRLNNVFLGDLSTLDDDGGKVEILYSATLNENAVVKGDDKLICDKAEGAGHTHTDACHTNSNDNDAYVKYGHIAGVNPGEDPKDPTEPPRESNHDDTKTYTYRFSIDKYVRDDDTTKLAGAEFELRQNFVKIGTAAVEGQNNAYVKDGKLTLPANEYTISDDPIALVDITPKTEGYKGGNVYRVAKTDAAGNVVEDAGVTTTTTIVTDETGLITIQGLDSMLYSITEKTAPKGYIKLEKSEMMAIGSMFSENGGKVFTEDKDATSKRTDANADYSFNPLADSSTTVGIANSSGIQMPRTGGIGTTIFYVLGGVMVVFAAGVGVVVIRKRRDGDAE